MKAALIWCVNATILASVLSCDKTARPSQPICDVDVTRFLGLPLGCTMKEVQELYGQPFRDHGSGVANYEYRLSPHGFALVLGDMRNTVEKVLVVWSSNAESSLPGEWSEKAEANPWAEAERLAREHGQTSQLHDPLSLLKAVGGHSKAELLDRLGSPIDGDEIGMRYLLKPNGFARIRPASGGRPAVIDIVWWAP